MPAAAGSFGFPTTVMGDSEADMRVATIFVALAIGCGGGGGGGGGHNMGGSDAAIDAPECASARVVPEDERTPVAHPPFGHDGGIILVDAGVIPDAFMTCNPLSQTGCSPGQKCTW